MRTTPHPCAGCGRPCWGRRCRACAHAGSLGRRKGLSGDWAARKERAAVVRAHREVYGDWCPGWGNRPAHHSARLSADHVIEVHQGGPERGGAYQVLCPGCNSAKSNAIRHGRMPTVPSRDASREW